MKKIELTYTEGSKISHVFGIKTERADELVKILDEEGKKVVDQIIDGKVDADHVMEAVVEAWSKGLENAETEEELAFLAFMQGKNLDAFTQHLAMVAAMEAIKKGDGFEELLSSLDSSEEKTEDTAE